MHTNTHRSLVCQLSSQGLLPPQSLAPPACRGTNTCCRARMHREVVGAWGGGGGCQCRGRAKTFPVCTSPMHLACTRPQPKLKCSQTMHADAIQNTNMCLASQDAAL